jgi:hypothetical protein
MNAFENLHSNTRLLAQKERPAGIAQQRGMPNEGTIDKLSTRILLAATNPRGAYPLPYNG